MQTDLNKLFGYKTKQDFQNIKNINNLTIEEIYELERIMEEELEKIGDN